MIKDKQLIKEAENLAVEFHYGNKKYNKYGKFILMLKFIIFMLKWLKKEPRTFFKAIKEFK